MPIFRLRKARRPLSSLLMWVIDWLVDRSIDRLIDWFIDWFFDWIIDLIDLYWLIDELGRLLIVYLIVWLLIDELTQLNDRLTDFWSINRSLFIYWFDILQELCIPEYDDVASSDRGSSFNEENRKPTTESDGEKLKNGLLMTFEDYLELKEPGFFFWFGVRSSSWRLTQ